MSTTDRTRIVAGGLGRLGYRRLRTGPGEGYAQRGELTSGAGHAAPGQVLVTIGHLSDLHLCDAQSPARAEFLDRWGDPGAPTKAALTAANGTGTMGTYRAQDLLTVAVAEAMVRALDGVGRAPVGGSPVDWALTTGDVTDNAQANELGWYLAVLEGGRVAPDSGDPSRYEGVADHEWWHEAFWHPDPRADGLADSPHARYGFPDAPGLLDAVRVPFEAAGLSVPWYAVHGNHDRMIQGTLPAVGPFAGASTGGRKPIDVPESWTATDVLTFLRDVDECRPGAYEHWDSMTWRDVTPDHARRTITRGEFVAAHFSDRAKPHGHGFTAADPRAGAGAGRAYYRHDHGQVSLLVLDTVDEHGGWQGSLDAQQLAWLDAELGAADRERRYVVLASHHPLRTLVNPINDPALPPRVLAADLAPVLGAHRSLVAWLNGHTHTSTVLPHADGHPWWEVTTPSLIDFPQQGRIVELMRNHAGTLTIATTMLDHTGEAPWSGRLDSVSALAGLSRELAANDWQDCPADLGAATDRVAAHPRVGTPADRNVLLELPDTFA